MGQNDIMSGSNRQITTDVPVFYNEWLFFSHGTPLPAGLLILLQRGWPVKKDFQVLQGKSTLPLVLLGSSSQGVRGDKQLKCNIIAIVMCNKGYCAQC